MAQLLTSSGHSKNKQNFTSALPFIWLSQPCQLSSLRGKPSTRNLLQPLLIIAYASAIPEDKKHIITCRPIASNTHNGEKKHIPVQTVPGVTHINIQISQNWKTFRENHHPSHELAWQPFLEPSPPTNWCIAYISAHTCIRKLSFLKCRVKSIQGRPFPNCQA